MFVIKKLAYNIVLVFLNYFVAYIPSWFVRKTFYCIFGMKIGKGSRINQRVYIYNPWNISIGNNTIINAQCIIDGRGGLVIGSNTSISMRSIIYTASHHSFSDSFEYFEKETIIGDCCWLGVASVVLPGSHIHNLAVIGANSVFKGNAEAKSIYLGIPAVFVRKREIKGEYNLKHIEFFT